MPCFRLNVQTENHQETVEFDRDEILIGRSADGDVPGLILPDESVSRKHARIWRALDGYWIEDLGSRYGTTVNGIRITARQQLQEGDLIGIGETTLRVNASDGK